MPSMQSVRLSLGTPCPIGQVGGKACFCRAFLERQSRRKDRRSCKVRAGLDPGTHLAVTQQGIAFAAVVVAEGLFTRWQLPSGSPGRPSLLPLLASSIGIAAALQLISSGEAGTQLGLLVGTLTSSILFFLYLKRFADTPDNPREWPGPKVWPATLGLFSFFAINIFGQALIRA